MSDLLTIALVSLAAVWLFATVLVLAICRIAARADAELAPRTPDTYRPLRARTWGTVRSMILKSPQSDQFATYK